MLSNDKLKMKTKTKKKRVHLSPISCIFKKYITSLTPTDKFC